MGVSTDAILVYGSTISAWDEKRKVSDPPPGFEGIECIYSGLLKVLRNTEFDVVRHCSSEYPMWIVGFKDSIIVAPRGYPKRITLYEYSGVDDDRFNLFMAKHKIPVDIGPMQLLCSDCS